MHFQQKILIGRDEDLSAVVEKMATSTADEIFLVIPEKSRIFEHFSDVQILKEEAENLNKKLAVITPDARGQEICLEVGIPVADLGRIMVTKKKESVQGAKRFFDIAPQGVVREPAKEIPEEAPPEEELPAAGPEETGYPAEEEYVPESEESFPPAPEEPPAGTEEEYAAGLEEELMAEEEAKRERFREFHERETAEKDRQITDFFIRLSPMKKVGNIPAKTKALAGFIAAAVIILAAALALVLPRAEITVETKKEKATFDFSINVIDDASAKIDLEKGIIPGHIIGPITESKSEDFTATGRKNLVAKAQGKISVSNDYSSAPQSLVKNTRFLSKEGKLFRLVKGITVPGAVVREGKIIPRSIEADVIADAVGGEYNIGPTTFTIPGFQGSPKYKGFYGESKESMAGGANGEVTVATRDDIEKAKTAVFKILEEVVNRGLANNTPSGFVLAEGAREIKVAEQTVSVQPDTRADKDKFSVTLKMTATAFLFKEEDLRKFVSETVAGKIAGDKEIIAPEEKIVYQKAQPDFGRKLMKLDFQAEETSRVKLDEAQLKQNLAGKGRSEFESLLSTMPGLQNSVVKLWPFWVRSVPGSLDKITLIVK